LLCSWWQEAERAYHLWKVRQVADKQGRDAVAVGGDQEGEARKASFRRRAPPRGSEDVKRRRELVDFAVHGLKGDLFVELLEMMG
jgi:hypothetical protein